MKPMQVPTGFPVGMGAGRGLPAQTRRGGTGHGSRHIDYRKFLACLNVIGQTEIAKVLGITESQVYNYASGNGKPTPVMIQKLKLDPRLYQVFETNMKESKPGEMSQASMPAGMFAKPDANPAPAKEVKPIAPPVATAAPPPAAIPVVPAKQIPTGVILPEKPVKPKKPKKPKKAVVVPPTPVEPPAAPAPAPIVEVGETPSLNGQEQVMAPWKGRTLCVMEPFYQSVVPGCHLAMKDWYDPTTMMTAQKSQEAFIERTRNRLATMFLKTECEWSLWIDADVITPCKPAVYRALVDKETSDRVPDSLLRVPLPIRLANWGKTIVSAVYFDRHGNGSIMAKLRGRPPGKLPQNCLFAADWVGTGCVLVHRKVFEDVAKAYPETAPSSNGESAFFTPWRKEDGFVTGEDEAFFTRAANAGHPSYVDLGMICGHVGFKCYGLSDKY